MRVPRAQTRRDQTALLSANSIAVEFEFEILTHSRCRLDRTIFRRINRRTGIFEMCEFGSKIYVENIILLAEL